MYQCKLKCYQCSGKLLGYYSYRVQEALQGNIDKIGVLNELSIEILKMLNLAERVKDVSTTCYQNINNWLRKYQNLHSKLQHAIAIEPINTS